MIWLVGNRGMLGQELSELMENKGMQYVGTDKDVNILDISALSSFAAKKDIKWIINCAAYTAVDRAEDEVELCTKLNEDGPKNLAHVANSIGAVFLHISTDYVFSGDADRPYREDDVPTPTGVYGATKAVGEQMAIDTCDRTIIVRTAWLYGENGPNFVSTMLRMMKERESIGVVSDQRGTPTWARDLANAIVTIIRSSEIKYGIYHFTDDGEISWYDFAQAIYEIGHKKGLLSQNCTILPLTTNQYPTKARRPTYSVLSKEKIKKTYGIKIPTWRSSLELYIENLCQQEFN